MPFHSAPDSLCILRLSAVGDISHTLPVVRTLQQVWPATRLYWIIGKLEHELVNDIDGIEFLVFDKRQGLSAYRDLRRQLRSLRFDALLHMQMSLRASLIAMMVNAPIKLGFDRQRAKDLQWLFTNHKIAYQPRQHVIESFFGFSQSLGITDMLYRWDIPIPASARQFASDHIPNHRPILVISPCSSMAYRNWSVDGYARVAEYAEQKHNMQVVLTGGPSDIERDHAKRICAESRASMIDLIGKTSLKQLLAVLDKADVLIAPDAGPAHLATAVGTPVIGLYATTNPDRARPYLSANYVINKYPDAVQDHYRQPVEEITWGARVRAPGTMDRITLDDVTRMLDSVMG